MTTGKRVGLQGTSLYPALRARSQARSFKIAPDDFVQGTSLYPALRGSIPKTWLTLSPVWTLFIWRRGRDSNPRTCFQIDGFQDRCNKPDSATPPGNSVLNRGAQEYLKTGTLASPYQLHMTARDKLIRVSSKNGGAGLFGGEPSAGIPAITIEFFLTGSHILTMNQTYYTPAVQRVSAATMNRVLRNTYLLLSMTLLFSAVMAGVAMALNWPYPGLMITLVGYFGLLFLTTKLRNSAWGIVSVFALTGFMGVTLGPIINLYLYAYANGGELVMMAMGGTAVIFLAMSGLALTAKRDFSFLGKFLMIGILVAFLSGIGAIVFHFQPLALAVSSMFIMLMAGLILWQTQQIVRGGETNYIMATVTLFISIFNLFSSLLHILGFGFGED